MKIVRNTEVISISLPLKLARKLERARMREGETRSNFIRNLIGRYIEDARWERIYRRGEETARKFNIRSEDDIEKKLLRELAFLQK